ALQDNMSLETILLTLSSFNSDRI
ncbi:hypothetical protein A4X13_0g7637, partial [Tilletia indica]